MQVDAHCQEYILPLCHPCLAGTNPCGIFAKKCVDCSICKSSAKTVLDGNSPACTIIVSIKSSLVSSLSQQFTSKHNHSHQQNSRKPARIQPSHYFHHNQFSAPQVSPLPQKVKRDMPLSKQARDRMHSITQRPSINPQRCENAVHALLFKPASNGY